jgi:hypothetical protein
MTTSHFWFLMARRHKSIMTLLRSTSSDDAVPQDRFMQLGLSLVAAAFPVVYSSARDDRLRLSSLSPQALQKYFDCGATTKSGQNAVDAVKELVAGARGLKSFLFDELKCRLPNLGTIVRIADWFRAPLREEESEWARSNGPIASGVGSN